MTAVDVPIRETEVVERFPEASSKKKLSWQDEAHLNNHLNDKAPIPLRTGRTEEEERHREETS